MKKGFTLGVCIIILLLSVGCGKHQDCILLDHASPDTSSMTFYYFDGEKTEIRWLYDEAQEKEIIKKINSLPTKMVNSEQIADMKEPCFGLEISDSDGYDIWLTYSNGLWLLKDGTVYTSKYDFEKLYSSIPREGMYVMDGGIYMLNSAYLGEYDLRYYQKAEEMCDTLDEVSISVESFDGSSVTLNIQNDSSEDFYYGTYYSLQKQIDGVWYRLPVKLSNYGFTDIGMILNSHSSTQEQCDLTMYGKLEEGHYRIEKEKMVAEFVVD